MITTRFKSTAIVDSWASKAEEVRRRIVPQCYGLTADSEALQKQRYARSAPLTWPIRPCVKSRVLRRRYKTIQTQSQIPDQPINGVGNAGPMDQRAKRIDNVKGVRIVERRRLSDDGYCGLLVMAVSGHVVM